MLIIVEGIDRVGKTTLINKLHENIVKRGIECSRLNPLYSYMKINEMDNKNETDKMIKMLNMYKSCKEPLLLVDRFHITDYSYGVVKRGYDALYADMNLNILNNELRNIKHILFYVQPVDISKSELQHGESLKEVYDMQLYALTQCEYKGIKIIYLNYNMITNEIIMSTIVDEVIEYQNKILGEKENE